MSTFIRIEGCTQEILSTSLLSGADMQQISEELYLIVWYAVFLWQKTGWLLLDRTGHNFGIS
jgi:hypothetical protein